MNQTCCLFGANLPNLTALLQSDRFATMMNVLRRHYDYIIVDTPLIGMVVDATLISRVCDASLWLWHQRKLSGRWFKDLKCSWNNHLQSFLGVVLNKYNVEADKYGFYGFYGHYGDNLSKE